MRLIVLGITSFWDNFVPEGLTNTKVEYLVVSNPSQTKVKIWINLKVARQLDIAKHTWSRGPCVGRIQFEPKHSSTVQL